MNINILYLSEKIAAYFESKQGVTAVYLFGSHAAGMAGPSSDIDIGIIMSCRDTEIFSAMIEECLVELPRLIMKDIHPVIMNSAGELLLKQIFSKGRCILVNDDKKLSRFKMVMFSRILDFSFYLGQMQSGFMRKMIGGRIDGGQ